MLSQSQRQIPDLARQALNYRLYLQPGTREVPVNSEFCPFTGFHKPYSCLILKTKQTSFSNKPVCYLESQGLQSKAQGSQSGLSPGTVFGPQDLHSQGLLSWDPSSLCLLCQPLRRMLIGSCQQAAGRQSPGKGDEGGGTAFCQVPRPLLSFPWAGRDSRKLPLSVLPS